MKMSIQKRQIKTNYNIQIIIKQSIYQISHNPEPVGTDEAILATETNSGKQHDP